MGSWAKNAAVFQNNTFSPYRLTCPSPLDVPVNILEELERFVLMHLSSSTHSVVGWFNLWINVWVAGKTVWSLANVPCLSILEMSARGKTLHKSVVYFTLNKYRYYFLFTSLLWSYAMLHLVKANIWDFCSRWFCRLDVLAVVQPTVSKHNQRCSSWDCISH